MITSMLTTALIVLAIAQLVALILLSKDLNGRARKHGSPDWTAISSTHVLCFGAGGLASLAAGYGAGVSVAVTVTVMAVSMVITRLLLNYRTAGALVSVTMVLLKILAVPWSVMFIINIEASALTKILLATGCAVTAVFIPASLLKEMQGWEVLLRSRWRKRAATEPRPRPAGYAPMVSVQVPIHAEPPDVVCRTLDALSRLNYSNYEVLVIDNNTSDERLWRPVEAHCALLGPQFRFLHVEGITGAKAGALNWARPYIDPRAELMALVDADYLVDPDWLHHTVGYFKDPTVGFVQCPQAYRDYESSSFTRIANAEYVAFFAADMIALNERGAGLTVGTMSVIRLAALDTVGGWAEWCVTEDSELSTRLHAKGYTSVYIERAYGRGLIPETWESYKKQRFRWTYGPVQEFLTHARLFMPGKLGRTSSLNFRQRIYHASHGLKDIGAGFNLLILPLWPVLLLSMPMSGDTQIPPITLILPFLTSSASKFILGWLLYRRVLGSTIGDMFRSQIAQAALSYVIGKSALFAIFGKPAKWYRTDKLRRMQSLTRVVSSAGAETLLSVLFLVFAVVAFTVLPLGTASIAMAIGCLHQGVRFAAAPALSYIAERAQRRQEYRKPAGRLSAIPTLSQAA